MHQMTHCKQSHCGIFQLKFESPVVVSLILTLYSDQKDIKFIFVFVSELIHIHRTAIFK